MRAPVIIIGIGQLGGVFARGLLRCGYPVYPITRDMALAAAATELPAPESVLVAVAEQDLNSVLTDLPAPWRPRVVLLQNELLPHDWQAHGLDHPTVMPIWFEKKKTAEPTVLLPTPVFGPQTALYQSALAAMNIPTRALESEEALRYELVRKNLYILTINIAGLVVNGSVETLWRDHEPLARAIANDVMDVQFWLTGASWPRETLIAGMLEAFAGDPQHACLGRTAAQRLHRTLMRADQAGLAVPALRSIGAR